jgi:hypothetical protein
MKLRYWTPLLGFVVPSVVMGFGFVMPRNGVGGVNELSIGFAATILGACVTYAMGIRLVLRDRDKDERRGVTG